VVPIRVLLVDDHSLLRAGLRGLLEQLGGIEVVGEAADGRKALELVGSLRPNILMTDIGMPQLDGLALTALVTRDYPATLVIILSMHTEKEYVDKALLAGATGYLIKDSGTHELEAAIRAVARGEAYLSPAISIHVIANYSKMAKHEAESDPLSPRQREVLRLIAEGMSTKVIARHLDISVKTVETHRTQLMERLGIHEIAGLVRYAIRCGLVDPSI
jgi:DNA-binding NarL/FixJ family response regulator